ncbi:MAG TPA: biotin/lipoyl-containing protein [Ktedonobacteraceae bacterium]|jgi:biotin carboxyl carrier protein
MAYSSNVHGQTYQIEITQESQPVQIAVNGTSRTLDWLQIARLTGKAQGGQYSMLIEGRSYTIYARNITKAGEKASQTYEIFVNGQRFEVKVEDERTRLLSHLTASENSASTAQIEAPMPGLVIGLPCEVGTQVQEGQTVVVLEAMKMENDLMAPIAGTIKELRVSKGQSVDQGELLVVIEVEQTE